MRNCKNKEAQSSVCCRTVSNKAPTDYQIPKHFDNILFTLLVATEEAVTSASSKHLAAPLIRSPQLFVGRTFLESVLLAKPIAPEGSMVGVDSIIRTPADQAEGDDILVAVQMMGDGLVELHYVRTSYRKQCMARSILR